MSWIKRLALVTVGALERINSLVIVIAALLIMALMFITVYEVVMRRFFHAPTTWSVEVSKYIMVFLIFLPLAYAQQVGRHITMDALTSRLSKAMQNRLAIVALALSLFFFIVFTWSSVQYALRALEGSWTSGTILDVPMFPVLVLLPVGGFLLSVQLLVDLIRHIAALFPKRQDNNQPELATGQG